LTICYIRKTGYFGFNKNGNILFILGQHLFVSVGKCGTIKKRLILRMKYLLAAACTLLSLLSFSQVFPKADYPRGYFRNPLNIPMSLAANFGELRPNHYHMGLDIRTEKRENLPVFAAADGYIARVVIEPGGFGQAIYINHPNGYTTLYAHLNKFMPALAAYIQQRQYKSRSWSIYAEIPQGLFPVKKGDQIAFSGNTGGSQGPHLHFEIRTTGDDTNLNPLLFGLPVPDNTPPVIQRLALYDRNKSTYEQSPRIAAVHKAGSDYAITPSLITVTTSRISFAISAFDTQSGSSNPNGIFQAVLYDNDQALVGFQMNNISYAYTRNLNAHIDYKTRATGGPFLQHLSALPGYTPPSIYRSYGRADAAGPAAWPLRPPYDGVIDLSDGTIHTIRIAVSDAYGNSTSLRFQVQFKGIAAMPAGQEASVNAPVEGVPANGVTFPPMAPPPKMFYPGMLDGYETASCAFYLGERSLYDSVHISYRLSANAGSGISLPDAVSAVHTIGAPWIPLQDSLLVRIKPNLDLLNLQKDKVVMVCFNGGKKNVQRPVWQGGWASARFREFGNFQLVDDKMPPVITPVGLLEGANLHNAARIAFIVKDNLGSVKSFSAELDPPADGRSGNWLCFTNDKGLAFIYKFDEHCPAGKHVLRVMAEDEAGNRTTKEYHFTR
jgi:murein DD-endopeptidase MepM/ murein hydrolase activator NlpD